MRLLLLVLCLLVSISVMAQKKPKLKGIPVDGFEQLLPRGAIPALVDPVFVAAREAKLPDGAWVLGFELGGQAFAYDLNVLNGHEIVNHGHQGTHFAAIW